MEKAIFPAHILQHLLTQKLHFYNVHVYIRKILYFCRSVCKTIRNIYTEVLPYCNLNIFDYRIYIVLLYEFEIHM